MVISGLTFEELQAARDVVSSLLGNELLFSELDSYSRTRWRLRLQVRDIDGPGARRHSHMYLLGHAQRPRRSRFACSHAYSHLFVATYERNPLAKVRTSAADYRNVWDFLENYQGVLDSNVGSLMFPLCFGDECTCETDEIPTDTLQEWLWGWGHAEMPSLKNTKTVGV